MIYQILQYIEFTRYSSVGTAKRLKEFIRFVVASNGSAKILFHSKDKLQMAHIAPQIGTLLRARRFGTVPLHIYR